MKDDYYIYIFKKENIRRIAGKGRGDATVASQELPSRYRAVAVTEGNRSCAAEKALLPEYRPSFRPRPKK